MVSTSDFNRPQAPASESTPKQPVKKERLEDKVSPDDTPEILVAEVDTDLKSRIQQLDQDIADTSHSSKKEYSQPEAFYWRRPVEAKTLAGWREALQRVGEETKMKIQSIFLQGGSPSLSRPPDQDLLDQQSARAHIAIAGGPEAYLKEVVESGQRVKDQMEQERIKREAAQKPLVKPNISSEMVEGVLKPVSTPRVTDPEDLFSQFQTKQKEEEKARETEKKVEEAKRAGLGQGMMAEARIERQQKKPAKDVESIEKEQARPASVEGFSEASAQEAPERAERGGVFSLADLMKLPEEE